VAEFGPDSGMELLHQPLDPLHKCILMDYFERLRTGAPFLPLRQLATLMNVSPHTLERAISEMEVAGLVIAYREKKGKRTLYMGLFPAIPAMHPRRAEAEAAFKKQYQIGTTSGGQSQNGPTFEAEQDPFDTTSEKQSQFDTASEKQSEIGTALTEKQSQNGPTFEDAETPSPLPCPVSPRHPPSPYPFPLPPTVCYLTLPLLRSPRA
jgi:DNA-binding MarR family transcriptional regulator